MGSWLDNSPLSVKKWMHNETNRPLFTSSSGILSLIGASELLLVFLSPGPFRAEGQGEGLDG